MGQGLKMLFKKYHMEEWAEKWFRRDNLIILILSGLLLVVIALPAKEPSDAEDSLSVRSESQTWDADVSKESAPGISVADMDTVEYAAYLEERLETLLAGMQGVGRVRVMITLRASEELVVEKDMPISRSNTIENDGEGGSRSIYQVETGEETVYSTQSGSSEPYVIKTMLPEIEGIAVVAEGAGTGDINKNITELIQALFGVEAHKVKVVKMSQ